MYEVRCVVQDKNLKPVLRFLKELAFEPPVVVPIDEVEEPTQVGMPARQAPQRTAKPARKKRGPYKINAERRVGRGPNGEGVVELLTRRLNEDKPETITANEMKTMMTQYGYSPGAYSYAQAQLCKRGVLAKINNFGDYRVNHDRVNLNA